MIPEYLSFIFFKKIENDEFWILTHPEFVEVYSGYSTELIESTTKE